jgi:hypothetical protein
MIDFTRETGINTFITMPLFTSASSTGVYQSGATIAAGDIKVLKHIGGSWNVSNINTLPTEISTTGIYQFPLSGTELTVDSSEYPVIVECRDVSGNQWRDQCGIVWVKPVPVDLVQTHNNAITSLTLSAGTISNAKFAAGAISSTTLSAGAISSTTLSAGTISNAKFAAGAISSTTFAAGAISSTTLSAGTISNAKFAAGAISSTTLSAGAISSTTFAAGAISSTTLSAGAISSTTFAAGAISSTTLSAGAISSTTLAANTIGASQIASNAITSAKIASGAITSTQIAANAITSATFANGAIGVGKINDGAITSATFAPCAINSNVFCDTSVNKIWNSLLNPIGTPISIDGGTATLVGMILKMIDDANGSTYDATTDSQKALATAIASGVTVTTNNDKTNYTLTVNYDAAKYAASISAVDAIHDDTQSIKTKTDNLSFSGTNVNSIVVTNNDKTNYTLTTAYDAAKSAASSSSVSSVYGDTQAIKAKTDQLTFSDTNVNSIVASKGVLNDISIESVTSSVAGQITSDHGAGNYNINNTSDITAIKTQTDKMSFNGSNINANATIDTSSIASDVDTLLTTNHGTGSWQRVVATGANNLTVNVIDESDVPIPDTFITILNVSSSLVIDTKKTDSMGNVVFGLESDTYNIRTRKHMYSYDDTSVTISGDSNITIIGRQITVDNPNVDVQTILLFPSDLGSNITSASIITAEISSYDNYVINDVIVTKQVTTAHWELDHFELPVLIGADIQILGKDNITKKLFLDVVIKVSDESVKNIVDYI